jgi:lysophospholipid acyltransferase (LPLAT)-like uncharacterized protein
MARSLRLIDPVAAAFGRQVALYSRAVVTPASTQIIFDAPLPPRAAVFVSWHESNLLALALHGTVMLRGAIAFVPPGVAGIAMSGWLEALSIVPVPLAAGARRGLGLRQMDAALVAGKDVLIAVDGPRGPRHRIAPGAVWLARSACAEIRPVGCAAWPALALPRWDRLLVPLPGARIALAFGSPLALGGSRFEPHEARIAAALDGLAARAHLAVHSAQGLRATEAAPWS